MDLGIIIALCVVVFSGGIWFQRIISRLNKIDSNLVPIIILHKEDLIKYYLDKGILPNPGMTERKKELIDRLEAGTIGLTDAQELANTLRAEEREARRTNNTDALIAILGLIALVAVVATLSRR